jgi:integrase
MTITFSKIAEAYLDARMVSGAHTANVRRVAGQCRDISAARVNAYLRKRLETHATVTVRSERTILLSLWKFAWEADIVADPPKGIARIKTIRKPTRAWTIEQLRVAISHCDKYDATRLRSGAVRKDFMLAWILLGYETGARWGDIFAFTKANIDGDSIRWTQHKTGDPLSKVLSPACQAAVAKMLKNSPDGRIVGWACGKRMAMRHMRQHLDGCGLDGSSKWLRRSGATHCEIAKAGTGRLHLGHRSVGLFETAYADWAQIRKNTPITPELIPS